MTSRKLSDDLDALESSVGTRVATLSAVELASRISEPPSLPGLLKSRSFDTTRNKNPAINPLTEGIIDHINDFGLCEVITDTEIRTVFTLDKLSGYVGQPLNDLGLKVGTRVLLRHDASGRVSSVRLANATAASS